MKTVTPKAVDDWLVKNKADIFKDLRALVRIPSVSDASSLVKPFGQPCRDAINFMCELGKKRGYATQNFENYVGAIEFSKGDKTVGIWAHLDVVPVDDASAWSCPPFDLTVLNDKYLVGRGVNDNKMPAIAVFYVFNCLRDLGVKLKHGYTLYMGTSEETGMEDARWFRDNCACPDLSLVPDCGFPVCIAQRGACSIEISVPVSFDGKITQGNNPSVTAEEVEAYVDGETLQTSGQSAHIFALDGKVNADIELLKALKLRFPADSEALDALLKLCGDTYGCGLNMAYCDAKSGALRMALTKLSLNNGYLTAGVRAIIPVTMDIDKALEAAKKACEALGMEFKLTSLRKPVSFPEDNPVIPVLCSAYNEVVASDAKPYVMSGGNYAAYIPNAIGFGPGMPRTLPEELFKNGRGDYHQVDECDDFDHIFAFIRIYVNAIIALEELNDFK